MHEITIYQLHDDFYVTGAQSVIHAHALCEWWGIHTSIHNICTMSDGTNPRLMAFGAVLRAAFTATSDLYHSLPV